MQRLLASCPRFGFRDRLVRRGWAAPRRASSRVAAAALAWLAVLAAHPAEAKTYVAERFDAVVRVLADGTLDVTETVVFRFEDGTFREVFRQIPTRRTDGIEIVDASMEGQRLPFGSEAGTVEVRRRNGVRVVWRFTPVEGITREFVLNYRVHGAVRRQDGLDLLAWRATPGEHDYRIESSTIRFELPIAPLEAPGVTTRNAERTPQVEAEGRVVQIHTAGLRRNGWVDTELRFPSGAVLAGLPAWQQHAARVAAGAGNWIGAAALIVVAGLLVLFGIRQSYDAPPRGYELPTGGAHTTQPPDDAAPAVAGALHTNGSPRFEHAVAALVSLAERGELAIAELPRGRLGQHDFQLTRLSGGTRIAGYEQAALDTAFKGEPQPGQTVPLSKMKSRLGSRLGPFGRALREEMLRGGLLDRSRMELRRRYTKLSLWLLVIGGIACAPAIYLIGEHGAWTLLVPLAFILLAAAAGLFAASVTPLSNDGVRRAHRWRAYRAHLRAIASGTSPASGLRAREHLPLAFALGLSGAWAKFLKGRRDAAPAWFHALPDSDAYAAFPAFLATGGANPHAGGAGGAGVGAAGGGASGAR